MIITLICPKRFDPMADAFRKLLIEDDCTVNPMTDDRSKKERQLEKSDAVLLVNMFGYLGQDSLWEYRTAKSHGCEIYAVESWAKGNGVNHQHFDELQAACRALVPFYVGATLDTHVHHMWPDLVRMPGGRKRYDAVERLQAAEEAFIAEAAKMAAEAA